MSTAPTTDQPVGQPPMVQGAGLLALQRSAGNQAVQRLLAGEISAPPALQRQLQVGPANDRYEREAERMAGAVSQHAATRTHETTQRTVQPTEPVVGAEGGALDSETTQTINQARGGGKPLDEAVRAPMERALNSDFSNTRVHTDQRADQLNERVGARAFTIGSDIFLKRGAFNPGSSAGQNLLYHEMTHVAQQGAAGVQRSPAGGPVVQRAVSKKQTSIIDKLNEILGDNDELATASQRYLTGLGAKGGSRAEKKERKQETKRAKSTLHLGGKSTDEASKDKRLAIRAMSLAELASGAPNEAIGWLQNYMTVRYPGFMTDIKCKWYLRGDPPVHAQDLAKDAAKHGGPLVLQDLFLSHSDTVETELTEKHNRLQENVQQLRPQVTQQVSSGTSSALRAVELKRIQQETREAKEQIDATKYASAKPHLDVAQDLYSALFNQANNERLLSTSPYQDTNIAGAPKKLGGGQFSEVYEVHYDKTKNTTGKALTIEHGVFKPNEMSYHLGDAPAAGSAGISTFGTQTAGRAVASSKVDELFGFGMGAKTKYAVKDNKFGTVQQWAEGSSPQVLKDDKPVYRNFDYDDPEIQRQLGTLQLFDAITGQVDRHAGNYYIKQDKDGTKISAIDNDLAFGELNKDATKLSSNFDKYPGLPLFVDKEVAERVLNTKNADLKNVLRGHIRETEINVTMGRFGQVKDHLRKLQGNTRRIQTLQKRVDELPLHKRADQLQFEGLQDEQQFWREKLEEAYADGAFIEDNEWGDRLRAHLNDDNSYYGMLRYFVAKEDHLIDVDD